MAPMVWTGLIVSPFRSRIRIQDQIRIRIRLRDGYMEQEHFTGRGSRPPALSTSNRNDCSEIFKLNWPPNKSKENVSFCVGPQRRNHFFFIKRSKARIKTRRRAGRCRMDPRT